MTDSHRSTLLRLAVRTAGGVLRMPAPMVRLLCGRPITIDGNRLGATAQLLLRLDRLVPRTPPERARDLVALRRDTDEAALSIASGIGASVRTEDRVVQGGAGPLPARLYVPAGVTVPGPALVYFHGGGFVVGSVDSHDSVCRFLAEHSGLRVISVGYRLAPENPFPAAVDDAIAAFRYVVRHASAFDALPWAIAVGGDSAGGNLAAVVAHTTAREQTTVPAFNLLLYPMTDVSGGYRSHQLFGQGYLIDHDTLSWYRDQYLPDPAFYDDPRVTVLNDPALTGPAWSGLPPTYVATAGFDPFRDEGAEYARRLAAAGVSVVHRSCSSLLHGFATFLGNDINARYAMHHAAGALRTALSLAVPEGLKAG